MEPGRLLADHYATSSLMDNPVPLPRHATPEPYPLTAFLAIYGVLVIVPLAIAWFVLRARSATRSTLSNARPGT